MVALTAPGVTMPMPTAPAAWSPAPATTGVPTDRPVASAPAAETFRADLGRFIERGQQRGIDFGGLQDFAGPLTPGDIQQESS